MSLAINQIFYPITCCTQGSGFLQFSFTRLQSQIRMGNLAYLETQKECNIIGMEKTYNKLFLVLFSIIKLAFWNQIIEIVCVGIIGEWMNSSYMLNKSVSSGIRFSTLRTNTFQPSGATTVAIMSTQRWLVFIPPATFLTLMISASARCEGHVWNERENVVASIFERIGSCESPDSRLNNISSHSKSLNNSTIIRIFFARPKSIFFNWTISDNTFFIKLDIQKALL